MHYNVHYQVLPCTLTESAGESAEWALPEDYRNWHTLAPVNYTWGVHSIPQIKRIQYLRLREIVPILVQPPTLTSDPPIFPHGTPVLKVTLPRQPRTPAGEP